MNTNYSSQDRGDSNSYQQYLEAMDAISVEKVASVSMFFTPKRGNTIVDVGMASGTSTFILANLFPQLKIIGVDINPKMVEFAQAQYKAPNLAFRADDGESLQSFTNNSIDGFFNCSAIHHITSYNGYDINRSLDTLKRQAELLKDREILVVRDFVKPEEKTVILELSDEAKPNSPSDSELLLLFAKTARSLAPTPERGFPLEEVTLPTDKKRKFKLFYSDAVEFIRRKDYYANWDIELQEEYGYLTQSEFENVFRSLGLRIVVSAPIYNPWIIEHRYKGQFKLYDLDGKELGFPPTNFLIVGEKTECGKELKLTRHLPPLEVSYLKHTSYRHIDTKQIFDIVRRPHDVADYVPYYLEDKTITILAKHGYPRPLANVRHEDALLDGKHFSGYITEALTSSIDEKLETSLERRFRIAEKEYKSPIASLKYYTSPGGIGEKVTSYFIPLNEKPSDARPVTLINAGFKDYGSLCAYDATQLLNTAQTGALIESRLELNLYNLFLHCHLDLPKWLGEKIEVKEEKKVNSEDVSSLLSIQKKAYKKCEHSAGFLNTSRAVFMESGVIDSHVALEYVTPAKVSSNTVISLPVCQVKGQVYVGLELRDLPVPQLFDDNSTLLTVPATRLSKKIHDLTDLNDYLMKMKIGDSSVERVFRLGEKYFPSIGITTEQVYPYIVWLNKPTDLLYWVSMGDLGKQIDKLTDAHLLTCYFRLKHALTV